MLVIDKLTLPVFDKVTLCATLVVSSPWLPKLTLEALRLATGAVPVPASAMEWGLPAALSVMVMEAARLPRAAGVKVTLIMQFPPAATELPQLLVWAKSLALVPVITRLVIFSVALPVLLTTTGCAELVEPRVWLLNVSEVGA